MTTMPEKRLEGQRTIITGASAGIGAAIAERYAAEGASIWAAGGGDAEGLKRVIAACRAAGVKADGRLYDLSDATLASDIMRDGADFLGGLDILVNCAGARSPGAFTDFDDDEIIRMFHVNAISVFIASREAARLMVPQGSGRILNIGSIFGEVGVAGNALYCATKATLHSLTRALAVELGPQGHSGELPPSRHHHERAHKSSIRGRARLYRRPPSGDSRPPLCRARGNGCGIRFHCLP